MYGKQQSWDNAWDVGAMSNYNTITSLAESPKQEGLIYAGTDDGLIQVSEDGGTNWRRVNLGTIKGLPKTPFVNDVRADLFDANVVYAALDNHKYGDYKPYLIMSSDKGRTWTMMNGDLPTRMLTWRLVQDHVDPQLLFAATEYGIYFTKTKGRNWIKLTGGLPTISFRDITIQRREDALVGASFGRGFYILDDITPIREFKQDMVEGDPTLLPTKDAKWYRQYSLVGSQGDNEWSADNPPFGAIFTYFMPGKIKSLKDERKAREKNNTDFPGWDALEAEANQQGPEILLIVKDSDGNLVNTVKGTNRKGFNSVNWRLNYPSMRGERLNSGRGGGGFRGGGGIMVTPGTYSVTLASRIDGKMTVIQGPDEFEVKPIYEGALPRKSFDEMNDFREKVTELQQDLTATNMELSRSISRIDAMTRAAYKAENMSESLLEKLDQARLSLLELDKAMNGNKIKDEIGERSDPTPNDANGLGWRAFGNTYGPTGNHKGAYERAKKQLAGVKGKLANMVNNTLPALEKELQQSGAPWVEGQGLIKN